MVEHKLPVSLVFEIRLLKLWILEYSRSFLKRVGARTFGSRANNNILS